MREKIVHLGYVLLENSRSAATLKIIISASWIALLVASIFAGVNGSLAESTNADQYVYTYAYRDVDGLNELALAPGHTNIIKIPFIWIQSLLPYGDLSYIGLNTLLIVMTVFGWSLALRLITKFKYIAGFNFLLSGILFSSPELAVNLSMVTIRNIEYAIALIPILLLSRVVTLNIYSKLLVVLLLSLLVASDSLFIYTLIPALLVGSLIFKFKNRDWPIAVPMSMIGAGALSGIFLKKLFEWLGFYILAPGPQTIVIPFESILASTNELFRQLFQLLGGNIFNVPITPARIGLALYFLLTIFSIVIFVKTAKGIYSERSQGFVATTIVCFVSILLIAYLFSNSIAPASYLPLHYGNIRYITIISFLVPTLLLLWSLKTKLKPYIPLIGLVFFLASITTVPQSLRLFEQRNALFYNDRGLYIEKISKTLIDRNVPVALTTFTYSTTVTFESGGRVNSYPIIDCNNPVHAVTNLAWYKPSSDTVRSALIVDPTPRGWETWENCNYKKLLNIYGEPVEKRTVAFRAGQPITAYIYDYDIRSKLNLYSDIYER